MTPPVEASSQLRLGIAAQSLRLEPPNKVVTGHGIDTQLIIYPNENHGITRPSYVRDRYERYLAWYDKYIKKASAAPAKPPAR